ncbi:uncharacterized protein [Procambarus clarkii]|uniref:uncharacterized protein n=1 Tax=Procambarus clarkii TaxID=6728 RepID=UPI0037422A04
MAEKVTLEDLDDVQDFLNKKDCLARLKYLGKQELVLVSAYLEIKIRANDSRVEILSKVHKHLKAGEKQESKAQSTKESEEVASTEKEDKEERKEEREREERKENEKSEKEKKGKKKGKNDETERKRKEDTS